LYNFCISLNKISLSIMSFVLNFDLKDANFVKHSLYICRSNRDFLIVWLAHSFVFFLFGISQVIVESKIIYSNGFIFIEEWQIQDRLLWLCFFDVCSFDILKKWSFFFSNEFFVYVSFHFVCDRLMIYFEKFEDFVKSIC